MMSAYARGSILPNPAMASRGSTKQSRATKDGKEEAVLRSGGSIHPSSTASRNGFRMQGFQQGHRTETTRGHGSAIGLPPSAPRGLPPLSRPTTAFGNRPSQSLPIHPSMSGRHVAVDPNGNNNINNAEMSQLTMSQAASQQTSRIAPPASSSHRQQQQQHSMYTASFPQTPSSNSFKSQESFFISQSTAAESQETRSLSSMPSRKSFQHEEPSDRNFHHDSLTAMRDSRGPSMAESLTVSRHTSSHRLSVPAFATPSRRSWMERAVTPKHVILNQASPALARDGNLDRLTSRALAPRDAMLGTTHRSRLAGASSSASSSSNLSGSSTVLQQGSDSTTTSSASNQSLPITKEMEDWLRSAKADLEARLDSKLIAKVRDLDAIRNKDLDSKLTARMQNLEAKEKKLEQKIQDKERDLEQTVQEVKNCAKNVSDKANEYLSKISREGDAWISKLSFAAKDHVASLAAVMEGALVKFTRFTDKAIKAADAPTEMLQSAIPFLTDKVKHISADIFRTVYDRNESTKNARADAVVSNGADESSSPGQRSFQSRRAKRIKDASLSCTSSTTESLQVKELMSSRRSSSTRSEPEVTARWSSAPSAQPPRPVTSERSSPEDTGTNAIETANRDRVLLIDDAQTEGVSSMKCSTHKAKIAGTTGNPSDLQWQDAKLMRNTQSQPSAAAATKGRSNTENMQQSNKVASRTMGRQVYGQARNAHLDSHKTTSLNQADESFVASVREPHCSDDERSITRDANFNHCSRSGTKRNHEQLEKSVTASTLYGNLLLSTISKSCPSDRVGASSSSSAIDPASKVRRSKRLRAKLSTASSSKTETRGESTTSRLCSVDAATPSQCRREKQGDDKAPTLQHATESLSQPQALAVQKRNLAHESQPVSKMSSTAQSDKLSERPVSDRRMPSANRGENQSEHASVRPNSVSMLLEPTLPTTPVSTKREQPTISEYASRSGGSNFSSSFQFCQSPPTRSANTVGTSATPDRPPVHQIKPFDSMVAKARIRSGSTHPKQSSGLTHPKQSPKAQEKHLADVTNKTTSRNEPSHPNSPHAGFRNIAAVTPIEKKRKKVPNFGLSKRSKTYAKRARQSAIAYTEDSFGFLT